MVYKTMLQPTEPPRQGTLFVFENACSDHAERGEERRQPSVAWNVRAVRAVEWLIHRPGGTVPSIRTTVSHGEGGALSGEQDPRGERRYLPEGLSLQRPVNSPNTFV